MAGDAGQSSVRRVQDFLSSQGADFELRELSASARTATDAAAAIGCEVAQIAKSLVFRVRDSGEPVLLIAAGVNRVDLDKIALATGLHLVKADADFVKRELGFAIGGVPPVAHLRAVTTLLDPDLKNFKTLWAAAGTPNAVFALPAAELERLTGGRWVAMAE